MATIEQHKAKAEHHLQFLETIPDKFPGWLCIVAFYVAVDLIEQLRAFSNEHSTNHHERSQAVIKNYPRIQRDYKALYNAAFDARYESMDRWIAATKVRTELIDTRLAHIKSFVESTLQKRLDKQE